MKTPSHHRCLENPGWPQGGGGGDRDESTCELRLHNCRSESLSIYNELQLPVPCTEKYIACSPYRKMVANILISALDSWSKSDLFLKKN